MTDRIQLPAADGGAAILAQTPEGIVAADTAGRVTFANAAARRLLAADNDDAPVRAFGPASAVRTLRGEPHAPGEHPLERAALHGETVVDAEWLVVRPDAAPSVAQGSAAPLYDAGGRRIGAVLAFRDATEQHGARRRLEDQAAELEMLSEELQSQSAQLQEVQAELEMANAELHASNQELERAQRVLRTVTDNASSALVMTDAQGRALFWNPEWEAMTGFREREMRSAALHDLVHHHRPDGAPLPFAECRLCRAVPQPGETGTVEATFVRADGTFFPVLCSARPVWEDGAPAATVLEVRDLTAQKRTEARDRFWTTLGLALQPIDDPDELMAVTARLLGEHLGVDRCAYAEVEADQDHFVITGNHTRGDTRSIVGRFAMSQFGAETLRLMRANEPYVVHDVLADPRVTEADLAAYRETQITAVVCVPLHKAGRFVAAMAVHQRTPRHWRPDEVELIRTVVLRCWESLERARAQRHLREGERRLRLAHEAGRIGGFEWRIPEDRVIWTEELERLYGLEAGAFEGVFDAWRRRVLPDDARRVEKGIQEALRRREDAYDYEFRAVLPDGAHRWLAGQARFEYAADGTPLRMLGVNLDVDARKRAEQDRERHLAEARAAGAEAEAANRAKSQFLATMSHELRTPINAVIGYTELLEMGIAGPVNEGQMAHLQRVRASSRHLLGLVNEILDLAKVESGQIEVEHERVPLAATVREALDLVAPQAAERGVELRNRVSARDAALWGDGDRIRQILLNLASNAVKFTQAGGSVTLSCSAREHPDDGVRVEGEGPWLRVDVEDTGIGIPPEKLSQIFEPFVQVEGGYTRESSGTGLGLTISRRLARLMAGDLVVHSRVGRGSCFSLWLPSASARADEGDAADEWTGEPVAVEGLTEAGLALARLAEPVVIALAERMRADAYFPGAASLDRAQLENHASTFLVDMGRSLVTLGEGGAEPALMRDGSEIQRIISELHGAQRARLGWPQEALRREFALLRELADQALRRELAADGAVPTDAAMRVVAQLLHQAERVSLRGWRKAAPAQR
jgi:PAS domain S-box-containing protein